MIRLILMTALIAFATSSSYAQAPHEHDSQDSSEITEQDFQALGCLKANSNQRYQVDLGNDKKNDFLSLCAKETNNSAWCAQLVRPNENSYNAFKCTYGSNQIHQLIHPDEATWKYPIEGVRVIQDLQAKGLKVCQIYNWWRPEPYNKNVHGAAGRHPFGTAIDVRFCTNGDADRAFKELCKMRAAKRIRAIGHYGSASLHIGVGDKTANTWGKSCI
ncbi:hypothetical protein [Bdellovibrio svalbardensis]|uniref:Peptidase M15A C-terminal domain-containing protein n=1 Tax=Bdellovibrio svalbardensis TaxID=2972972 RepID=A0ABT6DHP2_9BACT|nr:hypothetical protein [Bdellovibrio svalbardensis]MDG0815765.1 hypothetical protein [Bdellovibrio svalbardensis]